MSQQHLPHQWDLSCVDWAERIVSGRSLMPTLPLFRSEADLAVQMFDELRLPDVPGMPKLRDAVGDWFREIVAAVFGSRNPKTNQRMISECFSLLPKGQSKTTNSAGLLVTALMMNQRPRAEMLCLGPMQATADRAFEQATGMIEADPDLKARFRIITAEKKILDLTNNASAQVQTFSDTILTGSFPVFVLLDELHLLGRNHNAARIIRQIRGGLQKNPEGFFMIITSQSDEAPSGVFKEELINARMIRDGHFRGKVMRSMLPILYEFPEQIAKEPLLWQNPDNWYMVMPNLGRSVHLEKLIPDWEAERLKGKKDIQIWSSQHLNIEIGVGMKSDGWAGTEFWERNEDAAIDLDYIIDNCEAIAVGIDGGGLDDLFGLTVIGRVIGEDKWVSWSHAWCHEGVLERRKSIAAQLLDFEKDGDLTIVDDQLQDMTEMVEICDRINKEGLLAGVALDTEGPYGEFVGALDKVGINEEGDYLVGVRQGGHMMNCIKTTERKLVRGLLRHAKSPMMNWCVKNLKIEATATTIRATKQNAGDAKIDPIMALFDAVDLMMTNPEPKNGRMVYETQDLRVL